MSKRLVLKLAVTITALSAMTFLQGCGEEEDGLVLGYAWTPFGSAPLVGFAFGGDQATATATGGGQSASGSTAGAVAGAAGGGGGQVSGGAGVP
jgi:hypothetical protein